MPSYLKFLWRFAINELMYHMTVLIWRKFRCHDMDYLIWLKFVELIPQLDVMSKAIMIFKLFFCDVKLWFHIIEYDISNKFCLKIDFAECSKQAHRHTLIYAYLIHYFKVSENLLTQWTVHSLIAHVIMRWAE